MLTEKAKAMAAVSQIPGWLSDREAETLYDLAGRTDGHVVEVGSCYGRSTAAIALGSMAGRRQAVYAIDNFVGVDSHDKPSPERLRANLDAAGINGLVRIVPKSSVEAAADISPGIGLLFIDGAHDYESVRQDIAAFAPLVRVGGRVVVHDATPREPGVLKALDETLTNDTQRWMPIARVDSAVIYERRNDQLRHRIAIAMPGPNLKYCAAVGLMTATRGAHDVTVRNSGNGWDDMNTLWVDALNMAHRGEITHFAMLHSDIHPCHGWVDILAAEMDRLQADLISTAVALKDKRGLTSCGIGDHADPWSAFRRFTMRELHAMPETFGLGDTPHPDKYLLHNTGCWLADLRNPAWRTTDDRKRLIATLSFPVGAEVLDDGTIIHRRESEDWYFSRMVSTMPLKTYITRKVSATHFGDTGYPNDRPWGEYLFGDRDTASKWGGE